MAKVSKISWWQWLPLFRWRIVAVVDEGDDIPRRLPPKGAVLVGSLASPKWIAFDCPCRSGHRILLNTDKARRPRWSATVNGPLTISPSIDCRDAGRCCHYFIQNGHSRWANERNAV